MKKFIALSSWSRKAIGSILIAAIACMVACDDSSSASAGPNDEPAVESSSSNTQNEAKQSSSSEKTGKSSSSSKDEGPNSSSESDDVSSSSVKSEASSSGSEAGSEYDASSNTLKDLRDGKIYRTVTIGSQVWMAENLNYETPDSYCYNDSSKYCDKLGRLYKWMGEDSTGSWFDNGDYQRVCPSGWHLPAKAEFETLIKTVGGDSVASKKLKSTSGWFDGGNGTDDYAFTAFPSGYRGETGGFYYEDCFAYFWSSTENDRSSFYFVELNFNDDIAKFRDSYKSMSYSVRCVKD